MRTQVRAYLNEPTPNFFSNAEINAWLNRAQEMFVRKCPVLEDVATSDVNDGVQNYDLPGDCIKVTRVEYDETRLQEIRVRDYDKMSADNTSEEGTPAYYFVWNDFIRLWPIPSADGVEKLKIHYLRTPITMATDGAPPEIPQDYDEALVFYATSRGKMKDGEFQDAQWFEGKFNELLRDAQARIRHKTSDRFHVVRDADEEATSSFGIT